MVNRLRVLNALRDNDNLTRASLSSLLRLNKVSMSEIVLDLINEGVVTEGEKLKGAGRPGTSLAIKDDAAAVIGIDVQTRIISAELFNLKGSPLRFERVPRAEIKSPDDFKKAIASICEKMSRLSTIKILGAVIAVTADIEKGVFHSSFDPVLDLVDGAEMFVDFPFPVSLVTGLEAQVEAERFFFRTTLENMLFVNWGEHITSAIILRDRILPNNYFGHLQVSDKNVCHCGSVGCLDTVSSGWGLMGESARRFGKPMTGRDLIKLDEAKPLFDAAAQTLARALVAAISSTGVKGVIIGGGLSNLPDEYFARMMDTISRYSPTLQKDTPLFRSNYREKGTVQGAGIMALDEYFFNRPLLLTLGY